MFFLSKPLKGQPTYLALASDTIIVKKSDFGTNIYLLNGKRLNLPVMKWFMSDYPNANEEIRVANLSNKLSVVGYGFGGLLVFSGIMVYERNELAGKDLLTAGGIAIGGGLFSQLFTEVFKKRAVQEYNGAIHRVYQENSLNQSLNYPGLGLVFNFD